MDNITIMELVGILVAVVGGFKALEYILDKLFKQHDKVQLIDELAEYKIKNDANINEINRRLSEGHKHASSFATDLEKNLTKTFNSTMDEHKKEYMEEIQAVKESITEMKSVYQQTVAVVEIKIGDLEKKQDLHNSVISRMYECEKQIGILDNREKVSEHRLEDVERKLDEQIK